MKTKIYIWILAAIAVICFSGSATFASSDYSCKNHSDLNTVQMDSGGWNYMHNNESMNRTCNSSDYLNRTKYNHTTLTNCSHEGNYVNMTNSTYNCNGHSYEAKSNNRPGYNNNDERMNSNNDRSDYGNDRTDSRSNNKNDDESDYSNNDRRGSNNDRSDSNHDNERMNDNNNDRSDYGNDRTDSRNEDNRNDRSRD